MRPLTREPAQTNGHVAWPDRAPRRLRLSQLTTFALLAGVFAAVLAVVVALPLVWPAQPFRFGAQPFAVSSDRVQPGETLLIYVPRCNDSRSSVVIAWTREYERLSDGVLLDDPGGLRTVRSVVPPGCQTVPSVVRAALGTLPPGQYRLRLRAVVEDSGAIVEGQSAPFTIER